MYGYGPSGELLIARPVFRIRVAPQGPARVTDAVMEVNGRSVPATYSQDSGRLEFRPSSPLPPGEVEITASLVLNGNARFAKQWEAVVRDDAVADYLTPDAESNAMLRTINEIRMLHGLPVTKLDTCLTHISEMHSRYLNQNDRLGHAQTPGEPGFFGAGLKERLAKFGWNEPATEAVVANFGSPKASVEAAFAAPYHRIPFLSPGAVEVGTGAEGKALTMLFGHSTEKAVVLSPAQDQTNVPREWLNTESPNPTRFFETASKFNGFPIVIAEFGHREAIAIKSVTVSAQGQPVEVYTVDGTVDSQLRAAAFFIPKRPLQRGTVYRVQATWQAGAGEPQSRDWQFTTAL